MQVKCLWLSLKKPHCTLGSQEKAKNVHTLYFPTLLFWKALAQETILIYCGYSLWCVIVFALYLEGFECFLLWILIVDDGKGGGIVVNTTDLCTLNLIATLAHNLGHEFRNKVIIKSRDVSW